MRDEKGRFTKDCKIRLGTTHTEETKQKLRIIRKNQKPPNFGRKFSNEWIKNLGESHKGNIATGIQRKKISNAMSGSKHWNWKGGAIPLNKLLRCRSKWRIWRDNGITYCEEFHLKSGLHKGLKVNVRSY